MITAEDRAVYARAGFGGRIGPGARPALILVDVQNRTIGKDLPVLQAIEEGYGPSCGERAHTALPGIRRALALFRERSLPVLHSCVAPKCPAPSDMFQRLNPEVAKVGADGYEFYPAVAPTEAEPVVPKEAASAFFGTPMARFLIQRGVDSVVLVGCTTSGCIRSSAVDAFSYNFAVTVLSDAVYDRTERSHEVSLFEIDQKYGDVISVAELSERLA